MADLPASIGWMTISARTVVGLADSDDAGSAPDALPAVGTVTITPDLREPLVSSPDNLFIIPQAVTATFDASGNLVPPRDGVATPGTVGTSLSLIAPQQPGVLSNTSWTWTALFSPLPPQTWARFSRTFTGAPGAVFSLASLPVTPASPGSEVAVWAAAVADTAANKGAAANSATAAANSATAAANSAASVNKGVAGGTAALDTAGDVNDAAGIKLLNTPSTHTAIDYRTATSVPAAVSVQVYRTTAFSVPATTEAVIGWDAEDHDTTLMHDPGGSRITIPDGGDGIYLLTGQVEWTDAGAAIRGLAIKKNGGPYLAQATTLNAPTGQWRQQVVATAALLAGDYVEMTAYNGDSVARSLAPYVAAIQSLGPNPFTVTRISRLSPTPPSVTTMYTALAPVFTANTFTVTEP